MNWTINWLIVQLNDLNREIEAKILIRDILQERLNKLKEEENGKKNETQQRQKSL